MSPTKQKYQAYAAATQTVAKTKQIVLLYDGIIRFVQQAKEAIREKRIEDRYHILTKANEIIMGLQGCLDFENGGQIAKILYNFYTNISGNIYAIHRTNSIESCDEVIAELKKMRDVWDEIDQNASTGGTPPAAPPLSADTAPKAEPDQGVTLSA